MIFYKGAYHGLQQIENEFSTPIFNDRYSASSRYFHLTSYGHYLTLNRCYAIMHWWPYLYE